MQAIDRCQEGLSACIPTGNKKERKKLQEKAKENTCELLVLSAGCTLPSCNPLTDPHLTVTLLPPSPQPCSSLAPPRPALFFTPPPALFFPLPNTTTLPCSLLPSSHRPIFLICPPRPVLHSRPFPSHSPTRLPCSSQVSSPLPHPPPRPILYSPSCLCPFPIVLVLLCLHPFIGSSMSP